MFLEANKTEPRISYVEFKVVLQSGGYTDLRSNSEEELEKQR